jgi:predicted HTH transcriptional regulator
MPHEAAAFDVKAQLPMSTASKDIAVDVAAMATEGGVIIYGVREDKARGIFDATPIELAGVTERISEVVTANVRERIDFDVHTMPLDDDPSKGYVVVDVPACPRAPHMVETKNDFRYYGRVPGGNTILTEAQVARFYARRVSLEADSPKLSLPL